MSHRISMDLPPAVVFPTAVLDDVTDDINNTTQESPAASFTLRASSTYKRLPSWMTHIGAGIVRDVRARAPWYRSDWTDAWNYRVVPATALIFFVKYVFT